MRRSEEHTSELQSLRHLVCRLLLSRLFRDLHSFPTRRSSDLGFSVTGLIAGFGGFLWTCWTRQPDFARSAFVALGWGIAGAVCAGGAWAIVLLLAKHFIQLDAKIGRAHV